MSTDVEKNQLMKVFKALDQNGDGKLTLEELQRGYKKVLHVNNMQELEAIIDEVDTNKSGEIDYSEFVLATINKRKILSEKSLEQSFKLIDIDGNGFITAEELQQIFQTSQIQKDQWQKIIDEVDLNGDGKISYFEFQQLMKNIKF